MPHHFESKQTSLLALLTAVLPVRFVIVLRIISPLYLELTWPVWGGQGISRPDLRGSLLLRT